MNFIFRTFIYLVGSCFILFKFFFVHVGKKNVEVVKTIDIRSVRPGKKLKILNLARKGKMVILSEWDRLKPVIFLDLG